MLVCADRGANTLCTFRFPQVMEGDVTLPPAGTTAAKVAATITHAGAESTVNVSMPPNFQFAVRVSGGGTLWPRVNSSVLNHTAANCTEQVFLVLPSMDPSS
jgi:type V secretory pathway adhesin AidA